MQHSQRLDQRLHMLREEVRTMTQEKERGEHVWRERLQRCQRQLKAKEEEMIRQSQYFENFKAQLQHKLSLAQDREQSLQNRIYTLEKQLLDMTVSAANGTTIGAVRITAGSITCWEQQERLTFIRGEGEGEEEKKEEKRKQLQPSIGIKREGDQGKTEIEIVGGVCIDTEHKSNEARLQGFILSLQEDLRVLLEREEEGMTKRRRLMEQVQEAQENSYVLGCQVEERKVQVEQLKLSESSLMEEVEGLREENNRLKKISRETANQISSKSPLILESITSLGTSSSCQSAVVCPLPPHNLLCVTGTTASSVLGSEQVQPTLSEEEDWSCSSAVSLSHHQAKAQVTQSNTNGHTSSAKLDPLNLFAQQGSKPSSSHQSPSLTTETVDEFKMGTWCSRGILNLEENPSEESDALKEAYKSLWLQGDLEPLQEQNNSLEASMHHAQQENTQTHFQLRSDAGNVPASEQEYPGEKDYLVQALNLENRALADRIQELLAHIELKEQEIKKEDTQMREHIASLKEDRVRLQQENEEQECLITELTRKTEDDLNTIMDLQQKLEEIQVQHNKDECVNGLVESVLKGEETQLSSSQQIDVLNRASALKSRHDNHSNLLKSNPNTNNLHVSSDTDQLDQLTRLIHTLKTERDELLNNIHSLREQQREVALSVQTQTEEKQQLTRAVWGLKEEKDRLSQSLPNFKQEKEELSRTIIGLKHSRDHLVKSISGLKEEKEQLTKVLTDFKSEKKELIESLFGEREERDQVKKSLESLQMESDQLRQQVLNLKQERDELNISLSFLKEQRDQHQSFFAYQEDHNKLIKSVTTLKEEKQQTERTITCLKQEEKHIRLEIQHLKGKKNSLQAPLSSQTQTEDSKQDVHPSNPICVHVTKKTDTPQTTEYATQRCQTNIMKANSMQEQSGLTREIEALGEQLKKSQEELQMNQAQIQTLFSELSQSEGKREEAERKATQAAEKVMRLTDVANWIEETRIENESLNNQVKELQSKLKYLLKEKTDILCLKKKMEEQYNILAAQLRAKTVALEELNKEYIGLKQGQSSKDELSTLLMSLQTRYNDIRVRYDALLRKKSHTDFDIAPLKAKLSCLVVKCQERNSLLGQMMKAMRQHGSVDSTLTQQVDYLLRDAALQDYTATFAPGSSIKAWDYSSGFTPGFISKFQEYTHDSTSDLTCSVPLSSVSKQNGSTSEFEEICEDFKSQKKMSSHAATESTTNHRSCSTEITPARTGTITKNANLPEPVSPRRDYTSASGSLTPDVSMTEGIKAGKMEMSVSASKTVYAVSGSEEIGVQNSVKIKDKSLPNLTNLTGSSASAASVTSRTCVSPSRRLRSPEKITNLHEQLQKTLMSSYEAPVSRGRGQQPRKSLLFSSHAEQNLASQRKNLNLSFNSTPVTTASIQITTESQAISRSATLFNAVSSRSANLTLSPNMLMNNRKADMAKATLSASSSSIASNTTKSISSSDSDLSIPSTPTKEVLAIPDISDVPHSASPPLTQRTTSFDSNTLICSDTDPKSTASETTASRISAIPKVNIFNTTSKMDGASNDGYLLTASCTQSSYCSPKSFNTSASASLERKKKTSRPKPEAPLEVHSLEVLKTVGTSSLMVGWERPDLDELGCSNGTFVYGYRVFIDGDFHKSVMSSACTKCILENVDLNIPVQISVQTLGSNGLTSNFVHTTYIKDQH